jgi:hypothetical protein
MTTKSKKYNYNINALGNLSINNLNLGVSNIFSGSFSASNNVSSASNVTGLSFDNSQTTSFQCQITVIITRTIGNNLSETFTLEGQQNSSGWGLYTSSLGDITGINFSITSLGQIQYTSSDITNFSSSIFRYTVNQISKTGTYANFNTGTQGTYLVNSLQITNTIGSVFNVSPGAFHVLGGSTFEKSITIKTTDNSINFTNGGSLTTYGGGSFAKNLLVGGNIGIGTINPVYTLDINGDARISNLITSTNLTTTNSTVSNVIANNSTISNLTTTNSTVSNLTTTNSTVSNVIASNSTVSNLIVNSYSGSNLITTNSTVSNLIVNSYSGSNLITTNSTVSNLIVNSYSGSNLITTNSTVSNLIVNSYSGSNLRLSGDLFVGGTVTTVNITTTNISETNVSAGNVTAINSNVTTSTVGTSIITGNVGIGTASPSGRLHLVQPTADSNIGTVIQNGSRQYTIGIRGDTSNSFAIQDDTASAFRMVINTAGNVGFGTSLPTYRVDISGSVRATSGDITLGSLLCTNSNVTTQTVGTCRITNNLLAIGNSNTVGNVFTTGGNVGVGTSVPSFRLDVNDTMRGQNDFALTANSAPWNSTLTKGLYMRYSLNSGQDSAYIQSSDRTSLTYFPLGIEASQITFGGTSTRMVITTAGNVGIGINAPQAPLHIVGSSNNISSTVGGIMMGTDSNNYARIELISSSGSYVDFSNTGIDNSGRILYDVLNHYFEINTNNVPRFRLDSVGNMTLTGDLTVFGSISDMRWKTDITLLDINGMSVINNLRPVMFTWKDDVSNILKRGKRDVGFIAQEVEQVVDYVVDEYTDITNNEVYKKINHERLIPYLTLSLQQLDKKVLLQQNEIERLKIELESNKQEFQTRLSELLELINKITNV